MTRPITIATWNVNSVKSRLQHLLEWLREDAPDIVLLQEIKCVDEAFPAMEIEDLGYNLAVHGQKTYNGVAILSKFPLSDITRGLAGDAEDMQARYVEAVVSVASDAFRVASVYVPNGQSADSDKFSYKLKFLDRLFAHVKTLLTYEEMLVIGGDYNIAPQDVDVHDPAAWQGSVLTHDEVRSRWRKIVNLGMYDAWRVAVDCGRETDDGGRWTVDGKEESNPSSVVRPPSSGFTWWDYRAGAFAKNDGLRIDHLLLSPQAADKLTGCRVIKRLRELEKPSDHTPVVGMFGW